MTFSHSASDDVDPNTPSVDLSQAALQSQWVSPMLFEGPNPNAIDTPAVGCPESVYVSNYDSGGSIPFAAVNGQFVHVGSLVDPTELRTVPGEREQRPPDQFPGPGTDQQPERDRVGPDQRARTINRSVHRLLGPRPRAVERDEQPDRQSDLAQIR